MRQGCWRERDQKCVSPVASVASTAARSIQATISTSPVSASCTTAGMSPRSSNLSSSHASRLEPHLDAALAQVALGLGDGVDAEVEDRRGQHGVGPPSDQALAECSSEPAPPEAITGTVTASATARVSSRS